MPDAHLLVRSCMNVQMQRTMYHANKPEEASGRAGVTLLWGPCAGTPTVSTPHAYA